MNRHLAKIVHMVTPLRLGVAAIVAAITATSSYSVSPTVSKLGFGVAVAVTGVYAYWRPSEYQLRHLMSEDDLMVVPLRSSILPWSGVGESYGDPDGSADAIEFQMNRSCMVLGETGSGKTEAINVLAHQMRSDDEESEDNPRVAFDYKEDYQNFFDDSFRLSNVDSDVIWNVFLEMEDEEDATEVGKAIFSTADSNYFTKCARKVFADVLILLTIQGNRRDKQPTNKQLVEYFETKSKDEIREDLEEEGLSSAKHLAEDTEASENIYSNLEMQVTEVFVGDFGKKGEFSVREYMADPRGKTLILDLPPEKSESVKPIFRFLVDWSIRFGLIDDRGSYYILDEFAALPRLSKLERLVNAGRAYNCYAILGVQSVSQVRGTYGKEDAESVLSGLAQEVHLRVGEESVNYFRNRLGKERKEHVNDETGEVERVTEVHRIGESDVQNLAPGQAVIHTTEGWQRGRLYMLEEVIGDVLPQEHDSFRGAAYVPRVAIRIPALSSGSSQDEPLESADETPEAAIESSEADD